MTKKAFVIGMNTLGLKYCVNDAMLISSALEHYGYNVVTIKSGNDKSTIMKEFEQFIETCDKTDTFLFYFSGHGLLRRGKLELILANDTNVRSNKLPIREITDAIEDCIATNKLIVLDCCHAGASHEEWGLDSSDFCRILTASERLEKTKELDELEASFLTHHIYQALTNPPDDLLDVNYKIRINALHMQLLKDAESNNGLNNSIKVPLPNIIGPRS